MRIGCTVSRSSQEVLRIFHGFGTTDLLFSSSLICNFHQYRFVISIAIFFEPRNTEPRYNAADRRSGDEKSGIQKQAG
jgi:hypothetical protein